MKNFIIFFLLMLFGNIGFSQSVAINTDGTAANASAILDVKSTTKGVLVPRMTTTQRNAIASPAIGLLVYDTNLNSFFYRSSTGWVPMNTPKVLADADGNTKVQVEETANEDVIRFDISGDERMVLSENASGVLTMSLVSAGENSFIGQGAGALTSSGTRNTAVGSGSMNFNTTGSYNTAVGKFALSQNTTANFNTAVGHLALNSNQTGPFNAAFGNEALASHTHGYYNTAVGSYSLDDILEGTSNTALGVSSGYDLTNGPFNTFLGYATTSSIDSIHLSTAVGYNATVTASQQVRVGDALTLSIGGYQNWTNISDARFKNDVQENVPGLDFITRLRPVTYLLDRNKIRRKLEQDETEIPAEPRSTGFLAQEVEATAKHLGYEFSGVDAPKNSSDFYGLRYAEFTVPLVKAVQELDAENKLLKEQMATILKRLETLEAAVANGN